MPTVTATDFPYKPYPSTEAKVEVPKDYQDIAVSPLMFGSQVGAALERGGALLEQTSNELATQAVARQDLYNKIVSDKGQTDFSQGLNEKVYGNPKTGVVGLMGLHGEDAMRRAQELFGAGGEVEQLRNEIGSRMPNTKARISYNEETRRQATIMSEVGARHYAQEMDKYGQLTQESRVKNAIDQAYNNFNNPDMINRLLDTAIDGGVKISEHVTGIGNRGPITELHINTATDGIIEAVINGYGNAGQWDKADEIFKNPGILRPGLQIHNPDLAAKLEREIYQKAIETKVGRIIQQSGGLGATSGSGIVPPAPLAPEVYKPMINQAATTHSVPEELLTRVLSAESDFSPTATGPAVTLKSGEVVHGRGIAQFIEPTARTRGIKNPYDPNEAIPAAAAYLAQLHNETGSWHGAVNAYLGGEAKNNERYTHKGVWQLADQLDNPNAAPAPSVSGAGAPGASIPAQATVFPSSGKISIWGDSIGKALQVAFKTGVGGTSIGNAQPPAIRAAIEKAPKGSMAGETVVLSSGSNGQYMDDVEKTIKYLQEEQKANVILIGYGTDTAASLPQKNAQLREMAARYHVPVVSIDKTIGDGVHPTYDAVEGMVAKIKSLHGQLGASTPIANGTIATHPSKTPLQYINGEWVPYLPEGI